MDAALLGVNSLAGGGKEVRIAVTALEVDLPHQLERYQQIGIQKGEHKPAARAALVKILNAIATAEERERCRAARDTTTEVSALGSDSEESISGNSALHSQRAERFRGWHMAITSMSESNKPTPLLHLDLSTCPITGEPIFLQVLDAHTLQLQRDEASRSSDISQADCLN
jgi:hypothetical protein